MTTVTGKNRPDGGYQPIPDFGSEALGEQEVQLLQARFFDFHTILPIQPLPDLRRKHLEVRDGFPVAVHGSWRDCIALEEAETWFSFHHTTRLDGSAEAGGSEREIGPLAAGIVSG